MRLVLLVCVLTGLAGGCANPSPDRATAGPRFGPGSRDATITPSNITAGHVVLVNPAARFVVVSYPFGSGPTEDRRLNVTQAQMNVFEYTVLIGFPLLIIGWGISIFLKRR